MTIDTLLPTSGALWRKEIQEGILVELPSGNVARLRPVGMDVFLRLGRVPDTLTPLVNEILEGKVPAMKSIEETQKMMQLLATMCEFCFLEPRVVPEPKKDDEISADDIQLDDKYTVLNILNGGAAALRSFREKQKVDVGTVSAPEGNGASGVRNPEPAPMGE